MRYKNLGSLLDKLPESPVGRLPGVPQKCTPHIGGLARGGSPPSNKFAALMSKQKFRSTWDKTRRNFKDKTHSGYDMALVNSALPAGWTAQESLALLVAYAKKHHREVKALSYYQHTIAKGLQLMKDEEADGRTTGTFNLPAEAQTQVEKILSARHDPLADCDVLTPAMHVLLAHGVHTKTVENIVGRVCASTRDPDLAQRVSDVATCVEELRQDGAASGPNDALGRILGDKDLAELVAIIEEAQATAGLSARDKALAFVQQIPCLRDLIGVHLRRDLDKTTVSLKFLDGSTIAVGSLKHLFTPRELRVQMGAAGRRLGDVGGEKRWLSTAEALLQIAGEVEVINTHGDATGSALAYAAGRQGAPVLAGWTPQANPFHRWWTLTSLKGCMPQYCDLQKIVQQFNVECGLELEAGSKLYGALHNSHAYFILPDEGIQVLHAHALIRFLKASDGAGMYHLKARDFHAGLAELGWERHRWDAAVTRDTAAWEGLMDGGRTTLIDGARTTLKVWTKKQ